MNIAPEWVEDLPQDIAGMKICKIKCSPREWIYKSQVQKPEVLQDTFFEKERPNRNTEGRKVHWSPVLSLW